jgi:hypothetical protein
VTDQAAFLRQHLTPAIDPAYVAPTATGEGQLRQAPPFWRRSDTAATGTIRGGVTHAGVARIAAVRGIAKATIVPGRVPPRGNA